MVLAMVFTAACSWLVLNKLSTRISKTFSAKLLSSQLATCLSCYMELLHPRHWTWHLPLLKFMRFIWRAALPFPGYWQLCPSLISSIYLLRVHSIPWSRLLTKTLSSTDLSLSPRDAASNQPPVVLCKIDYNPLSLVFQPIFYPNYHLNPVCILLAWL